MPGALRVGAEQPEQVRAERAAGGPGLLAVEHPAAVDLPGLAGHRGQVAAGVRLGPALAPQVLGAGHAGEDPVALLGVAELVDARGQQEDAVLGDPGRGAGPVVLLLEEEPLPERRAAAAVLGRPGHHRPPVGEEASLPVEVLGEALARVTGQRLATDRPFHSARFASSQARASARKASSSADQVRSISGRPSRFRVALGLGHDAVDQLGHGGQLVDHAGDLAGGQDPDLGLAVDHRRLDQHRRVRRHRQLAQREVLVAAHGPPLGEEVAQASARLLAEPQRGERGAREPEQPRRALDAVDDLGADHPLRGAVEGGGDDGVEHRRRRVAVLHHAGARGSPA